MKTICLYDNVVCEGNNSADIMHKFIEDLLLYVKANDIKLLIKTKGEFTYKFWDWARSPHLSIRSKIKNLLLWYTPLNILPKKKDNMYLGYPKHILKLMKDLEEEAKLTWNRERGNVKPGVEADVVIVIPDGEIIFPLLYAGCKEILFFRHKNAILNKVKCFSEFSDMKEKLEEESFGPYEV